MAFFSKYFWCFNCLIEPKKYMRKHLFNMQKTPLQHLGDVNDAAAYLCGGCSYVAASRSMLPCHMLEKMLLNEHFHGVTSLAWPTYSVGWLAPLYLLRVYASLCVCLCRNHFVIFVFLQTFSILCNNAFECVWVGHNFMLSLLGTLKHTHIGTNLCS